MPRPVLTLPGFYGKLPQAGDFVTRRLPPGFVRFWDRWLVRHLAARLPDDLVLGFILAHGPIRATGLAIASADRGGRRFPLTLAVSVPHLPAGAPDPTWFAALATAAAAAARGELDPDALEARLTALPLPTPPDNPAAPPLTLWTDGSVPQAAADPMAPGAALDALLPAAAEAG